MPWMNALASEAPKVYSDQLDWTFSGPSKNVRYTNSLFCAPVLRTNTVPVWVSVAICRTSLGR